MKSLKVALEALESEEAVSLSTRGSYASFDQIDGSHRLKEAVPGGYVEYQVRRRKGGSIFFFNFRLAREMGLIPSDHPDEMTPKLREKLLDTFALVIINEYDIEKKTAFSENEIKPNTYMATRYLQLQHPTKRGKTSGDGRGIWNGEFTRSNTTWDISSSGTGATCLSPAHAQTNKFYKTGDRLVSYGNGYNCVSEGLSAAMLSEIFLKNGIETEQTLVIVSFEAGTSINVRASKNLLRPAHFFRHLKLGDYSGLRAFINFFIDRQIQNGDWAGSKSLRKNLRYDSFAEQMALTFSSITARFESDYIFCWLDWDGDNILANGGIIDYGSIRQFGLYHWEYRYDDVDRLSTNIPEQRSKARYIVQNFAQIRDFLITGKKKNIRRFRNDPVLKIFDQNFERVLHELLLRKIGLSENESTYILEKHPHLIKKLKKHHSYFEKTKSTRGVYKIEDGITCDAIFCMSDLHRELPKRLKECKDPLGSDEFVSLMRSSYAKKRDLKLNPYRKKKIKNFQKHYLRIISRVAEEFHAGEIEKALLSMIMRASISNPLDRITGDGILHVTSSLIRNQNRLNFGQRNEIIQSLIEHQVAPREFQARSKTKTGKIVLRNMKAIHDYREGF